MICRVCCSKILEETTYCHECGFLNGEIIIDNTPIEFVMQANDNIIHGITTNVSVKYLGTGLINAKFIIDDNDSVCFENGLTQVEYNNIKSDILVPVVIKNTSRKQLFTLIVESNDYRPDNIPRKSFFPDDSHRRHEYIIPIVIIKPKGLFFDRNLIVLNEKNNEACITVSNPNKCKVEIKNISKCDSIAFREFMPLTVDANDKITLSTEYIGKRYPTVDEKHTIEITYKIGDVTYSKRILFLVSAQKSGIIPEYYDYIISIDFGTSKTTGAYMIPYAPNVEIKDLISVPSKIAYNGDDVYAGSGFVEGCEWSTDRIKTHLSKPKIEFMNQSGESDSRDTETVVKDFLSAVKEQLLLDVLKDEYRTARCKYIVTVPVLDGDNGELQKYQKDLTHKCVSEVFLNQRDEVNNVIDGALDDVEVILESVAALYAVISSFIEKCKKDGSGIDLTNGDICLFDYGAGTLDISIGECFIDDKEKLRYISKLDIGRYRRRDENESITLGGDIIDENMFNEFCEYIEANGCLPDVDKKDRIDGVNAKYYLGVKYKDISASMEDVKIDISRNWNIHDEDSGCKVVPRYYSSSSHDCLIFTKKLFRRIVDVDIYAAIDAIKNNIIEKKVKDNVDIRIKHLFIVGGTGLLQRIKELIDEDPFFTGTKIYNPYDYVHNIDGENNDAYENMRQQATRAVSRGAVRWYNLKFYNNVNFNISIKCDSGTYDESHMLKKGMPLPVESRKPLRLMRVEPGVHIFVIKAEIDDFDEAGILGEVEIDTTNSSELQTIELRIGIDISRKLYLEYRVYKDGTEPFVKNLKSATIFV